MQDMKIFNTIVKCNIEYHVMSKNKIVAKYHDNKLKIIDSKLAPFYLIRTNDFESWVENRAIDAHRPSSRILKKLLRIKDYSDFNTALHNHAVTLTDCYWVKTSEENLDWSDVKLNSDYLANLIMKGSCDVNLIQDSKTYETTNTGSYEKCWKLIDDKWYMIKLGTKEQIFSEILTSRLCKLFGFKTARYFKYSDKSIISELFIDNEKYCLEEMNSLVDDDVDFKTNILALNKLEKMYDVNLVKDYLDVLTMDVIVYNVDRHTRNYGIIRDCETGNVVSMAPNYDNNLALLSNMQKLGLVTPKIFIDDLKEVINKDYLNSLPSISYNQLKNIVEKTGKECNISEDVYGKLTLFIKANYESIKRLI